MVNEEDDAEPTGIHKFRRTATGTVLAAGLLGVADALEGPRDEEVAIVTEYTRRAAVLRPDPLAPRPGCARGLDRARAAPPGIGLGAQRLPRDRVPRDHVGAHGDTRYLARPVRTGNRSRAPTVR